MANWIAGAIKHPGRCTPMSKPGCTGRARALAKRFKKGGDLHAKKKKKKRAGPSHRAVKRYLKG